LLPEKLCHTASGGGAGGGTWGSARAQPIREDGAAIIATAVRHACSSSSAVAPGALAALERAALDPAIGRDADEVAARAAVAGGVAPVEPRHAQAIAEAHRHPARQRAGRDDRGQAPLARVVELPRRVAADVRQQRHVAGAVGRQLGEQRRQRRQPRRVAQQVGAPALIGVGQHRSRRAPVDAVVDRQPHHAEPPGERRPARAIDPRAVGRHVLRERRGRVELGHQLGEAAEHERLATAVGDLERARRGQPAQRRRGGGHGPLARPRRVARAEVARQVACAGDPEHRHPRRGAAQPAGRGRGDAHVDAADRLEEQRRAVERVVAEGVAVGRHGPILRRQRVEPGLDRAAPHHAAEVERGQIVDAGRARAIATSAASSCGPR
jgi:hypothetical protein